MATASAPDSFYINGCKGKASSRAPIDQCSCNESRSSTCTLADQPVPAQCRQRYVQVDKDSQQGAAQKHPMLCRHPLRVPHLQELPSWPRPSWPRPSAVQAAIAIHASDQRSHMPHEHIPSPPPHTRTARYNARARSPPGQSQQRHQGCHQGRHRHSGPSHRSSGRKARHHKWSHHHQGRGW